MSSKLMIVRLSEDNCFNNVLLPTCRIPETMTILKNLEASSITG
ncbi:MAG: hypothetical protein ACLUKL_02490 [Parasutterella excrementihominis]